MTTVQCLGHIVGCNDCHGGRCNKKILTLVDGQCVKWRQIQNGQKEKVIADNIKSVDL